MSGSTEKKAELDSENIDLPEYDKVKLDKDGIEDKAEAKSGNLEEKDSNKENDEEQDNASKDDSAAEEEKTQGENRLKRFPPKLLIVGIGVMFLLLGAIGVALYIGHNSNTKEKPKRKNTPVVMTRAESTDGDLVMDPFIIFFRTKTGVTKVLIAQISLGVDPNHKQDLLSRDFDLRRKILNCLSLNVLVYKKKEIEDILRNELKGFGVRDLTFVRYSII